jgi:hypothetical protein
VATLLKPTSPNVFPDHRGTESTLVLSLCLCGSSRLFAHAWLLRLLDERHAQRIARSLSRAITLWRMLNLASQGVKGLR